jgi:hypothetical protein|nr:MAG TPA: hypothetical protein [Caudoviricetes sp.]
MKQIRVVTPKDLGRGIKANGAKKKYEVDLTQMVDNKTVRVNEQGNLEVIKEKCVQVLDLNNLVDAENTGALKRLGSTCFYGDFNAADARTAIGAPVDFGKLDVEKSRAITAKEDITSGQQLDFNGWQVATDREVHQYIYSSAGAEGKQSGWVRSNDSGMNADGSLRNPSDWRDWTFELNLPAQPAQKAGLDCEAIAQLPQEQWEKGTSILANKNGKCVRLVPSENFFQEIGVGIAANKVSAYTNEEFEVVVTVSNTGVGKNALTDWVITKPVGGVYDIKDVSVTSNGVDRVDTVSEFNYKLHGLSSGGTAVARFKVVPKSIGTFQFSSIVTPNSALDQDVKNNTATITLSATTKADPNYVPSVDCPLIIATELDSNAQLVQLRTENVGNNSLARTGLDNYGNLFANRETLKGLKIRLQNASTVVGYSRDYRSYSSFIVSNDRITSGSSVTGDDGLAYGNYLNSSADGIKSGTGGFTFENGVVTITADVEVFAISCRPQGSNCKWQHYMLSTATNPISKVISTSNVTGGSVSIVATYVDEKVTSGDDASRINVIPSSVTVDKNKKINSSVSRSERATRVQKLVFRVRAGTAASLTYTSTNNYAVTHSAGKTTITENKITVAADAKSTDSVNTKYIQVIVE